MSVWTPKFWAAMEQIDWEPDLCSFGKCYESLWSTNAFIRLELPECSVGNAGIKPQSLVDTTRQKWHRLQIFVVHWRSINKVKNKMNKKVKKQKKKQESKKDHLLYFPVSRTVYRSLRQASRNVGGVDTSTT